MVEDEAQARKGGRGKRRIKRKYDFDESQTWAREVARLRQARLDDGATIVLWGKCPDCRHEMSVELPIRAQTGGLTVTEEPNAQTLSEKVRRLREAWREATESRAFRKIARCNCQMLHEGRPEEVHEGCGSYGALRIGAQDGG